MIFALDYNCAIRLESLVNDALSSPSTTAAPFVSLQPLADWRATSRILEGFIEFSVTLRLLRVLSFNDRFCFKCRVLALTLAPLFTLVLLGGVLFVAFFSLFYLLFFSRVEAFYSPLSTLEVMAKAFLSECLLVSFNALNTVLIFLAISNGKYSYLYEYL